MLERVAPDEQSYRLINLAKETIERILEPLLVYDGQPMYEIVVFGSAASGLFERPQAQEASDLDLTLVSVSTPIEWNQADIERLLNYAKKLLSKAWKKKEVHLKEPPRTY